MFAFTIDGFPIMGPAPNWDNFWAAIGVWVTHSGGVGKAIAEWMTEGEPDTDVHEADISRFHEYATSKYYVQRTVAQQYREVYDIIHPMQQMEHTRNIRLAPYHKRMKNLGGYFFESVGWERPQWYEINARLLPQYADHIPERKGWEALYWSPIQGAEHLATRERVAMYELSSFVKLEVNGPGAADYLERLSANRVARGVGKVIYTALLTDNGGIKCDLTITRLAEDRFWVLTGGGSGMSDLDWIRRNAPDDGSVYVQDVSSKYTSVGLWGPKARKVLESVCEQDVSNEAFPYFTAQELMIETVPVLALRISYVGELGWEIYTPSEYGLRLWDALWKAGQAYGIIPAGMGAFDSLRLEKGYRSLGIDIHMDYNPLEAGLDWAVRLDKDDFKGKAALLEIKKAGISRKLCCLTLDEGTLLGKEPILKDSRVIGYVTSSNYGYSIGKQIAYGYLPIEFAEKGTQVQVEYFGNPLIATASDDPQYDPKMEKIKA
jgi:glycine cleavage system T protein